MPFLVTVTRPFSEGKLNLTKGEQISLLLSHGDGYWSALVKGKTEEVQDQYTDFTGKNGAPTMKWWVKIRLPNGKEGWVLEGGNFSGHDSCG